MLQEMKQEVGRIDWTQAGAKLERLIRLCENGQANDPEAVALVKDVYEMQYALERVHADASRMQENDRMQEAVQTDEHETAKKTELVSEQHRASALGEIDALLEKMRLSECYVKELRNDVVCGKDIDTDLKRQLYRHNAERLADNFWIICEDIYGMQEAKRFEQRFGKERKSPVKVCVRKLYGKPETVTLYK